MLGEQPHATFFTHALELIRILEEIPKMSLYVWNLGHTPRAGQGLSGRAREASTETEGRACRPRAGSRVDRVGKDAATALRHARRRATRCPALCAVVIVGRGVWGATVSLQAARVRQILSGSHRAGGRRATTPRVLQRRANDASS